MDGKTQHIEAEKARENGDFLEALKYSDDAFLSYQSEGNIIGMTEVLCSRFITFKHLFEKTNDKSFLILGKFEAKAAVKIAKKSEKEEAYAIPLFNLGKAYSLLEKYDKASEKYQEALDYLPKSPQNRPGVRADITIHKEIISLKNGDQSAVERIEQAVEELKNSNENTYEKDVWVSGAYLKLAQQTSNKEYLDKAREIIEVNPDLKLRKQQLEKISSKLN